tara:strand:- start:91 stop:342 length:252 start_codon:yes stop_codon:yes gene_type:complete
MKLDIKNLKKQIIYRCTYSGSKENELLYKKYFLNNLDKINYSELNQIYIIFNNLSDPEIYNILLGKKNPPVKFINLFNKLMNV